MMSTIVNYLVLFQKLIEYIRAHRRSSVPVIILNDWSRNNRDMRAKRREGSLTEEQKIERELS